MTFEDFLHESQVGYSTIETKDDLEYVIKRTWNAAIESVLRDLQSKVHINTYNVTTIDYDEATRVCTRMLSKSS